MCFIQRVGDWPHSAIHNRFVHQLTVPIDQSKRIDLEVQNIKERIHGDPIDGNCKPLEAITRVYTLVHAALVHLITSLFGPAKDKGKRVLYGFEWPAINFDVHFERVGGDLESLARERETDCILEEVYLSFIISDHL